jgi:DeoR family transcriptional regulator, fructose operon transcriptional repressor
VSSREERQTAIRDFLAASGRAGVDQLASALGVTSMTIRRDLAAMERSGIVTRTYGGCVLQSPFVQELPFSEKDRQQTAEKLAIAREAVRHLSPGDHLYLDTGTTAVHLAQILPSDLNLEIFTNNLRLAMELFGREGIEVTVYGGKLAARSPDLVGEIAYSHMADFRVDLAIIGADAIDTVRGEYYSADSATAMLARSAHRQASQILVTADSTKFGKHSLTVVGRLGPDVTVISDEALPEADRQRIDDHGAKSILVSP